MVVNWNRKELLRACLGSIERQGEVEMCIRDRPKVMRRPRAPRKTGGDGTQKKRVSRPRKKPPVG